MLEQHTKRNCRHRSFSTCANYRTIHNHEYVNRLAASTPQITIVCMDAVQFVNDNRVIVARVEAMSCHSAIQRTQHASKGSRKG